MGNVGSTAWFKTQLKLRNEREQYSSRSIINYIIEHPDKEYKGIKLTQHNKKPK